MNRKKKAAFSLRGIANDEWPTWVYISIFFGLFFLVVSALKIAEPAVFAKAVFRGHIVPYPLVNIAALLFMWLEFMAAFAALCIPKWRCAGLCILVGLLAVYSVCMSINLIRGLNTVCGCFGTYARMNPISWWAVARNCALMAIGLYGIHESKP